MDIPSLWAVKMAENRRDSLQFILKPFRGILGTRSTRFHVFSISFVGSLEGVINCLHLKTLRLPKFLAFSCTGHRLGVEYHLPCVTRQLHRPSFRIFREMSSWHRTGLSYQRVEGSGARSLMIPRTVVDGLGDPITSGWEGRI